MRTSGPRSKTSRETDGQLEASTCSKSPHSLSKATPEADRNVLYDFLQTQLVDLRNHLSKLIKKTQLQTQYWLDFREQFLTTLRIYYLSSVAETRRPANDVTLFDQTAASVAFFKAALAQNQSIAQQRFLGEATFTPSLSKSTRDTLSFGKLVASMLPQPVPQFVWLKQQWPYRQEDICPVCGQRSQGPSKKSLARKVCDICEQRRINRSEEWIKNPSTTIWIDEVADRNGQLVLLVGQFGVANWLSGTSFNSIVAFDPKSRKLDDIKFDMLTLVQNIQKNLIPSCPHASTSNTSIQPHAASR
jgi:hypothetical protein